MKLVADQAIHAEAVVESLQAQLWSGAFDDALFLDAVRSACEARWQQLPFHGALALEMPEGQD